MTNLFLIFGSVGGVGFSPIVPGTVGSLVGLLMLIFAIKVNISLYFLWGVLSVLFLLGWVGSHQLLKNSSYQDHDPGYIVIDEVVGMGLTVLVLMVFYPPSWALYGLSFVAFRIFDIFKPWPIGWIDHSFAKHRSLAALGIMIDDIIAGFMAALGVELLAKLTSQILNYSLF